MRRGRWAWLASLTAVSFVLLPLFLRNRTRLLAGVGACTVFWTVAAYVFLPPNAVRGASFSFARASVDGRAVVSTDYLLADMRRDLDVSSDSPLRPDVTGGEVRYELFQGETWRLRAEGKGEVLISSSRVLPRVRGEETRRLGWKSRAQELALDLAWRSRAADGEIGSLERALGAPGAPFSWVRGEGGIACRGEMNALGLLVRVEAEPE